MLHRRDARAKIGALLVMLVAIGSTPPAQLGALGGFLVVLTAGSLAAGLPLGALLARAAVVLPFSAVFAGIGWLINGDALYSGALAARSFLSGFAVLLVMGTTPLPALLLGLRSLGTPPELVQVLQSLVRYLQVIVDQGQRMRRAALCRGGGNSPGRRKSLWGRAAGAIAVLFGRSYDRAEGVHRAMLARGFQGEFLSLRTSRFTPADWLLIALAIATCGAIRAGAQRWA